MERNNFRDRLISEMKIDKPLSPSHFTQWCKKYNYIDVIESYTDYLPDSCRFTERIYHVFYDLTERPKCKHCNIKFVKFINITRGYRTYCSTKCLNNDSEIRDKIEQTNLENCGHKCNLTSDDTRAKIEQTNLEKRGVKHHSQSEEVKEKKRQTSLRKYGVEFPAQAKDVKEQIRQTNIQKFGGPTPAHSSEVRDKMSTTEKKNFFEKLLLSDEYDILTTVDEYNGIKDQNGKVYYYPFRCKKCNTEFIDNLSFSRPKCPSCNPKYISKSEQEIAEFCRQYYPNLVTRDRSVITPHELDIYIPEINLAIEHHGLFYHSEEYGKDKYYHQRKLQKCLNKDIVLIQVFEDEWLNNRSEIELVLLDNFGNLCRVNHYDFRNMTTAYTDARFGFCKEYVSVGLKYVGLTEPVCYYFKCGQIQRFTKQSEECDHRIWDAGQFKYERIMI